MEDKQRDLIDRLLFPRSQEDWETAKAENDAAPREPGRYKIGVGGEPHITKPTVAICDKCGATIRSKGGGIRFGDPIRCKNPAHQGLEDCLLIHTHQSVDLPGIKACAYWKCRLWRARCKYGDKKLHDKYRSWKWKRRAKRERADPSRWAEFWKWSNK
jgi:hypothetical protein